MSVRIAILLVVIGTAFQTGCSNLFYYPTRTLYVNPKKLNPPPTEHSFSPPGKKKLVGWYFDADPKQKPKAVILFFHGNAQNVSSHFYSLFWITPYNYDFFVFDYPGYGGSDGEPDPENTVEAGIHAARWLRKKHPDTPLAVLGQSLGGAVSMKTMIEVKDEIKPCLITVESTFSSYQKVARQALAQSWATWAFQPLSYVFLSDHHAPEGGIAELSPTPLIVIHGNEDPIIDKSMGQLIYNEASAPKEFWLVPGGKHIDAFTGAERIEFQRRYIETLRKYCSVNT